MRVNDVLWHETSALLGRGPRDRVYTTRAGDDGKVTVLFGDGATGARLPSGTENVRATYRKGIGKAGNVKAGQLSLLMSRPLGLREAINPVPAAGGDDPEPRDRARVNAPLTVLTLGRIVSLRDYEDFARAFAGVAKALATWTWDGERQGVFVTIAGVDGAPVADTSETYKNLVAAMHDAGDPYVPLRVKSYAAAKFKLAAAVTRDPDYLADKVEGGRQSGAPELFRFRRPRVRPTGGAERGDGRHAVGARRRRGRRQRTAPARSGRRRWGAGPAAGPRAAAGDRRGAFTRGAADVGGRRHRLGGGMMNAETLYNLLPAIYRVRDAEQAGPLQALMSVLAEQVTALEENLAQLYDDQFIETAADWVVPYIGDLIGYRGLYGVTPELTSPRAEVANTIAYRRRKGTAAMLEQLARDVTGWDARVVEFFERLATTQYMNHTRPDNLQTPDLRRWEPLERIGIGVRHRRPHGRRAPHQPAPGQVQHPQRRHLPVAAGCVSADPVAGVRRGCDSATRSARWATRRRSSPTR